MSEKRRILYLDCFSGISGDMFLGALLDVGVSADAIRQGLSLLPIGREYQLRIGKILRQGISGTALTVTLPDPERQPKEHGHEHGVEHGHEHEQGRDQQHDQGSDQLHDRDYRSIHRLIADSDLPPAVKKTALQVFQTIGEAEAAVHGIALEDVHFHEVGAVDSIVDIVGSALALDLLGVDEVVCSTLADGSGTISCRHGVIPVPVPAVAKMLEGSAIPYRTGTCDTELVTPTGMGLVKTICHSFGPLPEMLVRKTGYGFGQRDIGRLNALRVFYGESAAAAGLRTEAAGQAEPLQPDQDEVLLLSCNLDNSTPEQLGYAAGQLMQAGALDVSFQPLFMKNAPGGS